MRTTPFISFKTFPGSHGGWPRVAFTQGFKRKFPLKRSPVEAKETISGVFGFTQSCRRGPLLAQAIEDLCWRVIVIFLKNWPSENVRNSRKHNKLQCSLLISFLSPFHMFMIGISVQEHDGSSRNPNGKVRIGTLCYVALGLQYMWCFNNY